MIATHFGLQIRGLERAMSDELGRHFKREWLVALAASVGQLSSALWI
jgi:hypothetical protein